MVYAGECVIERLRVDSFAQIWTVRRHGEEGSGSEGGWVFNGVYRSVMGDNLGNGGMRWIHGFVLQEVKIEVGGGGMYALPQEKNTGGPSHPTIS